MPHCYPPSTTQSATWTPFLSRALGRIRERLWRLALMMDHLDMTTIKSRDDLISGREISSTYLVIVYFTDNQQYGDEWTAELRITSRPDMSRFVHTYAVRL